jgi:hypothetical protein
MHCLDDVIHAVVMSYQTVTAICSFSQGLDADADVQHWQLKATKFREWGKGFFRSAGPGYDYFEIFKGLRADMFETEVFLSENGNQLLATNIFEMLCAI